MNENELREILEKYFAIPLHRGWGEKGIANKVSIDKAIMEILDLIYQGLDGKSPYLTKDQARSQIDDLFSERKRALIDLIIRKVEELEKNLKDNFLHEPYCNECRLSETFCQCKGFNQALSQLKTILNQMKET